MRLGAAILIALDASVTLAQSQTDATIAVICRGADDVPTDTLNVLCAGLQNALAANYPDARFVLAEAVPKDPSAFIAFEALSASKAGLEARLTWQTARSGVITGPRIGFSVSDKDLTPALQTNFLNRLVRDAELPF